jgi:hypothetical protein
MASENKQLLARVWKPGFTKLSELVDSACLKRDPYLDRVFGQEARRLKDEIPQPNSKAAHDYLRAKLDELDRVTVNFSLSAQTVEDINASCRDLNIIRDCFVNRMIILLLGVGQQVSGIDVHEFVTENLLDNFVDAQWTGGLNAISGWVTTGPFAVIREAIDENKANKRHPDTPFHACVITQKTFPELTAVDPIAFNSYLPDEHIPGSEAQKRDQERKKREQKRMETLLKKMGL